MKHFARLLILLSVVVLWPASASAQGTYFIAELNNGLGVPTWDERGAESGYALGVTLGFGGKPFDGPLRLYGLLQANGTSFSAERRFNGKLRVVERQITDYNAGVRLLTPLAGRLRVFADLAMGVAQVDSLGQSPELPGNILIRDTVSDFALFAAFGLQYRVLRHLSLGLKFDVGGLIGSDQTDVVTAATSDGDPSHGLGRFNSYLTITAHF